MVSGSVSSSSLERKRDRISQIRHEVWIGKTSVIAKKKTIKNPTIFFRDYVHPNSPNFSTTVIILLL